MKHIHERRGHGVRWAPHSFEDIIPRTSHRSFRCFPDPNELPASHSLEDRLIQGWYTICDIGGNIVWHIWDRGIWVVLSVLLVVVEQLTPGYIRKRTTFRNLGLEDTC